MTGQTMVEMVERACMLCGRKLLAATFETQPTCVVCFSRVWGIRPKSSAETDSEISGESFLTEGENPEI
jgi:hypothetical protein